MRIALLFNPVSGRGEAAAAARRFARALDASGHDPIEVPSRRDDPDDWLAPALASRDALLVFGGDGAVRLAAGPAARAGVPLQQVPFGTENLFARQFGASRTPAEAVAALAAAKIRRVDLGEIRSPERCEPFTLMASAGLDAAIVHDLATRRRGPISHLSYAAPILRTGWEWKAPAIRVAIDGGPPEEIGRGLLVVANAPAYALGLDPARGSDPADGRLDAVLLPCDSAAGALAWGLRLLAGESAGGLPRRSGRSLEVEARAPDGTPVPWQVDGDPFAAAAGPVTCAIRPDPLLVLEPAGR